MAMIGVALMFTGAVLLLNGLALLGKVDPHSIAGFNLVGGLLNIGAALQAGLTQDTFSAGKLFLFGITYLWLAYNALTNEQDWRAFGWYCGFVAAMAFPTAAITLNASANWF